MNEVVGVLPVLLRAFMVTLELAGLSALLSLGLGILTATMYISPVPPLRWLCGFYIRFVRNTPITIIFFLTVFGLPQVGIRLSFFTFAVVALTLYTATFIAETIRAGVLAIPIGQIEAARSIGLTFTQVVGYVVLPQALRSVVPPLASVFIALLKNTSVASAFGLAEAVSTMTNLVNVHSTAVLAIMMVTVAIYISLALLLGRLFAALEMRLVIAR